MAIYHLSVKIIGRSSGRSSVAAAAYRSGDTLTNEYDGLTHDYSRKHWIEHIEILLPGNAPKSFKDRSTLWNAVESAEKSNNSQLAREIEIALQKEITLEQQTALIRAYIDKNFVSQGMCADFAIHNPPITDSRGIPLDSDGNPTQDLNKMTSPLTLTSCSPCAHFLPMENGSQSHKNVISVAKGMNKSPFLPASIKKLNPRGGKSNISTELARKKSGLQKKPQPNGT